jgi:hypothetical protein
MTVGQFRLLEGLLSALWFACDVAVCSRWVLLAKTVGLSRYKNVRVGSILGGSEAGLLLGWLGSCCVLTRSSFSGLFSIWWYFGPNLGPLAC